MVNKLGFTLSELSLCNDPMIFVFKFVSEDSEGIQFTITKEPINLGQRLQIFEFDEPNDIAFEFEGYYSYEIYQEASNNLVEVGLLRVEGPDQQPQQMTNAKNPQVYGK